MKVYGRIYATRTLSYLIFSFVVDGQRVGVAWYLRSLWLYSFVAGPCFARI